VMRKANYFNCVIELIQLHEIMPFVAVDGLYGPCLKQARG